MNLMHALRAAVRVNQAMLDPARRSAINGALRAYAATTPVECLCCGYRGRFHPFGLANRPGARCPACGSLERHRVFKMAIDAAFVEVAGREVLHFAAEPIVTRLMQACGPSGYRRADIDAGKGDLVLDIEAIDLADASVDTVLCSHVLEHVDDRRALAELYRILRPGGVLVAMVPIVEGWATTYERADCATPEERLLHYGQDDHVRYYGADFRDRVRAAGFALDEFTAGGPESVRYGLMRGAKVFRGTKPA